MKKIVIALLSLLLISKTTDAQFTRYLVKLKHKGGTPFTIANPAAYLSQRAIDRRTRYSIAIDSTDLPSNPSFISQIDNIPNVTILNVSKWLNQLSIETTDANAITAINALPFVQSTAGIAAKISNEINAPVRDKFLAEEQSIQPILQQRLTQLTADYFNYGTNSFNEINLHCYIGSTIGCLRLSGFEYQHFHSIERGHGYETSSPYGRRYTSTDQRHDGVARRARLGEAYPQDRRTRRELNCRQLNGQS